MLWLMLFLINATLNVLFIHIFMPFFCRIYWNFFFNMSTPARRRLMRDFKRYVELILHMFFEKTLFLEYFIYTFLVNVCQFVSLDYKKIHLLVLVQLQQKITSWYGMLSYLGKSIIKYLSLRHPVQFSGNEPTWESASAGSSTIKKIIIESSLRSKNFALNNLSWNFTEVIIAKKN